MLKPIEKAIELVDKMYDVDLADDYGEVTMCYKHAKQCALISVDEILKSPTPKQEKYWEEVKQEIEKL